MTIYDKSTNELNTQLLKENYWSTSILEDGEPLDYTDKWGEKKQPNYSISI